MFEKITQTFRTRKKEESEDLNKEEVIIFTSFRNRFAWRKKVQQQICFTLKKEQISFGIFLKDFLKMNWDKHNRNFL